MLAKKSRHFAINSIILLKSFRGLEYNYGISLLRLFSFAGACGIFCFVAT